MWKRAAIAVALVHVSGEESEKFTLCVYSWVRPGSWLHTHTEKKPSSTLKPDGEGATAYDNAISSGELFSDCTKSDWNLHNPFSKGLTTPLTKSAKSSTRVAARATPLEELFANGTEDLVFNGGAGAGESVHVLLFGGMVLIRRAAAALWVGTRCQDVPGGIGADAFEACQAEPQAVPERLCHTVTTGNIWENNHFLPSTISMDMLPFFFSSPGKLFGGFIIVFFLCLFCFFLGGACTRRKKRCSITFNVRMRADESQQTLIDFYFSQITGGERKKERKSLNVTCFFFFLVSAQKQCGDIINWAVMSKRQP